MVVYVRYWATELMHGNVDRDLEISSRVSAWDWFHGRLADEERVMTTEGAQASFSSSERLAFFVKKVRQFVVSPTIWQLSVLGTASESKKARRKSRILFDHLAKSHGL